jgi:hypothetical protein
MMLVSQFKPQIQMENKKIEPNLWATGPGDVQGEIRTKERTKAASQPAILIETTPECNGFEDISKSHFTCAKKCRFSHHVSFKIF